MERNVPVVIDLTDDDTKTIVISDDNDDDDNDNKDECDNCKDNDDEDDGNERDYDYDNYDDQNIGQSNQDPPMHNTRLADPQPRLLHESTKRNDKDLISCKHHVKCKVGDSFVCVECKNAVDDRDDREHLYGAPRTFTDDVTQLACEREPAIDLEVEDRDQIMIDGSVVDDKSSKDFDPREANIHINWAGSKRKQVGGPESAARKRIRKGLCDQSPSEIGSFILCENTCIDFTRSDPAAKSLESFQRFAHLIDRRKPFVVEVREPQIVKGFRR
jgi:hypothetical protein